MAELVPYSGPVSRMRNSNPVSREAELVLHKFMGSEMEVAAVVEFHAETERFYKSLWGMCQKEPYQGQVKTSLIDGTIILTKTYERR